MFFENPPRSRPGETEKERIYNLYKFLLTTVEKLNFMQEEAIAAAPASSGVSMAVVSEEGSTVTADAALSATSENPVQNKVIYEALEALERISAALVPTGTEIPENADLNTIEYIKVGNYCCGWNAKAATLTNCPVSAAFMMNVYSPMSATIDNESAATWVYRLRKLMTYTGDEYIQCVSSANTAGLFTYGDWKPIDDGSAKITVDAALSATSENPVQNKAIYEALANLETSGGSSGDYVAKSGDTMTGSLILSGQGIALAHQAEFDGVLLKTVLQAAKAADSTLRAQWVVQQAGKTINQIWLQSDKTVVAQTLYDGDGNKYLRQADVDELLAGLEGGTTSGITGVEGLTPIHTYEENGVVTVWASEATEVLAGLISAEDQVKLDTIEAGATKTTVDSELSATSENPVQNKAIYEALAELETSGEGTTLVPSGTRILAPADLNTIEYIKVGNYYCSADATVAMLSNCPTEYAFMMTVYSPLSATIDNESTDTEVYRVRKIMTYTGDEYIQCAYSGDTAGSFTYGPWKQIEAGQSADTTEDAGVSVYYGTCATAASTTAKVVVCEDFAALTTGAAVYVRFTNANTAASPTLNVNGTGAVAVKKYGTTASMAYMWYIGEMVQFVYDGTYWVMVQGMVATTAYYGLTKLSSSTSSTSTSLAATASAVKAAYDLASTANTLAETVQTALEALERISAVLTPTGTEIPENADLNTIEYIKVGNYSCGWNAKAATLTNCPVSAAFMMTVYSPLSETIDNESTASWVYRIRKIMTYTGDEYIQCAYSGDTAGSFSYNAWKHVVTESV